MQMKIDRHNAALRFLDLATKVANDTTSKGDLDEEGKLRRLASGKKSEFSVQIVTLLSRMTSEFRLAVLD